MKKLLSAILTLALTCALTVPAGAAGAGESADARLAQVTAKVKTALGIGDEYAEFYGELRENELAPTWSLNWSGEGESLTVEATEAGKVLSYYLFEDESAQVGGGFRPSFPATTRAQAQAAAEAFLGKVLGGVETAYFQPAGQGRLDADSHRFTGVIRLNGLDSPLTFSVTVRASDGRVIRFHRDGLEGSYIGGVPASKAAAGRAQAGELLKGVLSLRLEYVLDEDGRTAVLRYLPEPSDEYVVDAQTGKLVNLTERFAEAEERGWNGLAAGGAAYATNSAEKDAGLSGAEQAGIAKLEGVRPKEELDGALRAMSALGLGKYTLASASYSLDQESGGVTARLVYSRRDDDGMWRRTVTVDAKTGALQAVDSSAPYAEGRTAAVGEAAAQKTAEAFLTSLWGEEFGGSGLYESSPWTAERGGVSHGFTYARRENGYFFPENALTVAVDCTDGSISGLSRTWTEDVSFASADGLVDEAAALEAWFGHYDVALAYRAVPVKLDPASSEAAPLVKLGYSYFYELVLSYALESGKSAAGVDARTGEVVYQGREETPALTYSDLEGHWARDRMEALAQYGIGWTGGVLRPDQPLTQIDLLALLASTQGYRYDPETGSADDLYRYAYQLGLLQRGDREDGRAVTRGEVVRVLLDGAGYGDVAALRGIFTCSFADRDAIPAELAGYAALAQGMGIVGGGGSFAAGRTATRAEAAVMLYNFMNR